MERKLSINNRTCSPDGINRRWIKYNKDGVISAHDIAPRWASKRDNSNGLRERGINEAGAFKMVRPIIGNNKPVGSDIRVIERMHKKYLDKGFDGLKPGYHNTFDKRGQ